MRKYVLASGNTHKKEEYEQLIKDGKVEIMPSFTAEENGYTYMDNARLKLASLKNIIDEKKLKYPAGTVLFADDSGLEILSHPEILGLYTSRFCEDEHLSQEEKNQRVITIMQNENNRKAKFVCHISFMIIGDNRIYDVEGELPGDIAYHTSGMGGFGYDPIFIPSGESRTLSDLGNVYKGTHSHRYNAVCNMLSVLNKTN